MPTRLDDVLHHAEQNYLLPFIWLHGESEAVLRQEVDRIQASGIGAFCMEARPHPDFFGPQWWHDVDLLMAEARQRNMRVWLLDDDSFPTGHANGRLIGAPAELRRLFLQEHHVDALGPQPGVRVPIEAWTSAYPAPHITEGARLIAAVAARRHPHSNALTGELIDLTDLVEAGALYWDVPEGIWRIFVFTAAQEGGMEHEQD
jgi:hypothetical protein